MFNDFNSRNSGNGYANRQLKRMKLIYKKTSVKFAVNPEDYTQVEPNRATLTQTKGGAWIDSWGAGIIEITIKGTTGVKGTGNSIDTGYNRWKELRDLIISTYDVSDGEEITELIKFYNFTDNEYYYCYPASGGIELHRSKSRPHMYQYTVHLWGLRRIGQPVFKEGSIGKVKITNTVYSSKQEGSSKLKTSKSTTNVTSAGTPYVSRTRALNSEADVVTTTNTRTKSFLNIQEDCLDCLKALEPLIGGKAGKISPVTGFLCTQGITMQSSGTISNVTSFTGKDLSSNINLLLSEVRFLSKVSSETYDLFLKIREYSPDVLSPSYSLIVGLTPKQRVLHAVTNSTAYDSTIYELITKYQTKSILSKNEVNHVKIVLLESMMVYRELYRLSNETEELQTILTINNMDTLVNNIRSLIMYFNVDSNEFSVYQRQDVSLELRTLEKIMTQVQTNIVNYL